jgi:phosphopantetheinyl transferase
MSLIDQWECISGTKLKLFEMRSISQIYEETGMKHSQRSVESHTVDEVIGKYYTNHELLKDEFGKPYLVPKQLEINYSHTQQLLFWGEHPSKQIGVDIETLRPQLTKIKHKFCREDELAFVPNTKEIEYLLAIWSSKEAIYKAYGKKEVDFRDHMQILPFSLSEMGYIEANFLLDVTIRFRVYYRWNQTQFMCWTLLNG